MKKLDQQGFQAYIVGGFVRDLILQHRSKDIDIATDARPNQVISLFNRTAPTGLQHGTVTVMIDKIPIEVTTFRMEKDYDDHRHPSVVQFVNSLEADLSRRDFTINAMAIGIDGELYDPFGGEEDLQRGLIRAVGNAEQRFDEDALRMIRAIRFATTLQFKIESSTEGALLNNRSLCQHLSIERIVAELEKILDSEYSCSGIQRFFNYHLWKHLPVFCRWNWIEPTVHQYQMFDLQGDRITKWLFLFLLGNQSDIVIRCQDLHFSNHDKNECLQAFDCYQLGIENLDEESIIRILLKYGLQTVKRAFSLTQFMQNSSTISIERFEHLWNRMMIHHLKELAINGNDLLSITNRSPGSWIAKSLEELLFLVASGKLPNHRQNLLEEGRRIVKTFT